MLSKWLPTIIAGAISAWACAAVAQYGTPIDGALPFIAVIVTVVAAVSRPAVQLAVPLLIGGEIVLADERLRLLWFGLVIAVAFAVALLTIRTLSSAMLLTAAAIVLLRWIPLANVVIWREVVLLVIALLIAVVFRAGALSVTVAVAVALFTPLVPLRTIGFPIAVLVALVVLREIGMPRLQAGVFASLAFAIMLLFFPWSGVFARATPLAFRGLPPATARAPLRMALGPGESVSLDVPGDATGLILSGANMSRLPAGTIVGSLNRVPLRVGDIADWGALRREHFYGSRNGLPANPAGALRDYGQCAWVDGAARFSLARTERNLRVTADAHLPAAARLQIDAFELERR